MLMVNTTCLYVLACLMQSIINLAAVQEILAKDLAEGQYFVTGNLTPEVFADDCRQMPMLCASFVACHMYMAILNAKQDAITSVHDRAS